MAVSIKGLIFASMFVSGVFVYCSFIVIPSIILLPLSVKYSRIAFEQLILGKWFGFVAAFLELIYGIKTVISGDIDKKLSTNRPTLIIMNHRCRFDWLYLWSFLVRLGSLAKERIVLKSSISSIPFFGWSMDLAMFIFLHRKWSDDEQNITDIINFYHDSSIPVQLLLFPEGTDLSDKNKQKDRAFAEKNGLHVNEYVLHPRTTGFVHFVKVLKEKGEFDIYDISVGYVGSITQGEKELLNGELPSEIHFKCRRVPYSEFSSLDEEQLGFWLETTWDKKEKLLKDFYQNKSFDSSPVFKDDWTVKMKLFSFILYTFVCYGILLYYLPWTLVAVAFFGILTYCVRRFKGGWTKIILNMANKKKEQ